MPESIVLAAVHGLLCLPGRYAIEPSLFCPPSPPPLPSSFPISHLASVDAKQNVYLLYREYFDSLKVKDSEVYWKRNGQLVRLHGHKVHSKWCWYLHNTSASSQGLGSVSVASPAVMYHGRSVPHRTTQMCLLKRWSRSVANIKYKTIYMIFIAVIDIFIPSHYWKLR